MQTKSEKLKKQMRVHKFNKTARYLNNPGQRNFKIQCIKLLFFIFMVPLIVFSYHDVCYFTGLIVKQTFPSCSLVTLEHFTTAQIYLYLLLNKLSDSPLGRVKGRKAP